MDIRIFFSIQNTNVQPLIVVNKRESLVSVAFHSRFFVTVTFALLFAWKSRASFVESHSISPACVSGDVKYSHNFSPKIHVFDPLNVAIATLEQRDPSRHVMSIT